MTFLAAATVFYYALFVSVVAVGAVAVCGGTLFSVGLLAYQLVRRTWRTHG